MEGLCRPMPRTINRINAQIPKLRTPQRIPSVNRRSLQCHSSKYEEALPEEHEFLKVHKEQPSVELFCVSTQQNTHLLEYFLPLQHSKHQYLEPSSASTLSL